MEERERLSERKERRTRAQAGAETMDQRARQRGMTLVNESREAAIHEMSDGVTVLGGCEGPQWEAKRLDSAGLGER